MRPFIDSEKILGSLKVLGVTFLGASTAYAGEIFPNTDVTDVSGVKSAGFTLALPGTNTFVIQANTFAFGHSNSKQERVISMKAINYGRVKTVDLGLRFSSMVLGMAGQKWSTIAGHVTKSGTLAGNTSARTHKAFPAGHYTDAYFAFTFKDSTNGNQLDYGWLEASLIHDGYTSLDVNIVAYAWEPDGAELALGAAPSDVPEPPSGTLGLAIGAMILGAAGVRRWKSDRKVQETAAA